MNGNRFLQKMSNIMMKIALFFVKLAIWCVIIYFLGMKLFDFGNRLFYERALSNTKTESISFVINEGDNAKDIANKLKEKGIIDDTLAFQFRAKLYKTKFNPNTYTLDKSMTIKNMLDIFDDKDNNENQTSVQQTNVDEAYQLAEEDQEIENAVVEESEGSE